MKYRYANADIRLHGGSIIRRQHFVLDETGRPIVRTVDYMDDSDDDKATEKFLKAACDLMSAQAQDHLKEITP